MRLPGSTQLSLAKKFLLTLPWNQLAPATNIFDGALSAAATSDRRCALAFTVGGKTLTVDFAKFGASATARWFDPTSGELKAVAGSPFPNSGSRELTPPGKNSAGDGDWVLVLAVE